MEPPVTGKGIISMISLLSRLTLLLFMVNLTMGQGNAEKSFNGEAYEDAIKVWDKMLEENPELKGIHYNQGNAQVRLGELDEAIKSYEQALSLKDRDALADVYYNMGNAYLQKQDTEKAKEFYRQALRLRPHDEDAKANLELLNHIPPPPPQDQQSDQNQDDQENQDEDQKDDQKSDSQDQDDKQQDQEQQDDQKSEDEQQQDQSQNPDDGGEDQKPPEQSQDEQQVDQEELMNAQQLLDALKDRETENMREQIRLKTSGQDNEKDW